MCKAEAAAVQKKNLRRWTDTYCKEENKQLKRECKGQNSRGKTGESERRDAVSKWGFLKKSVCLDTPA